MFEFTNAQRKYFAIPEVEESWERIEVPDHSQGQYKTYAYLDGLHIVKVIQVCETEGMEVYTEFGMDQYLSKDRTKLMPKRKGSGAQRCTASYLEKRPRVGMSFYFIGGYLTLINESSRKAYYRSVYGGEMVKGLVGLSRWIDEWAAEDDTELSAELKAFAMEPYKKVRLHAGDIFRFRISRGLYGYGIIGCDFKNADKSSLPFWKKELSVGIFHIITEERHLSAEYFEDKKVLPFFITKRDIFESGECEIIGGISLKKSAEAHEHPIHYGMVKGRNGLKYIRYQSGERLALTESDELLGEWYESSEVSDHLKINLSVLWACIKAGSNTPYWEMLPQSEALRDLRNPILCDLHNKILEQLEI